MAQLNQVLGDGPGPRAVSHLNRGATRPLRIIHEYGGQSTIVHDLREPLPLEDEAVDAVFAHMALCMALSTKEIRTTVNEIRRVLRPGGTFIYTVRHTGDAHYGAGNPLGDDIFEHGGFAVHFFSRQLVDALAGDWVLDDVYAFEEGDLPRRLWRVTLIKPD